MKYLEFIRSRIEPKKPKDTVGLFLAMDAKEHTKFMRNVIHNANEDQLRILKNTSK